MNVPPLLDGRATAAQAYPDAVVTTPIEARIGGPPSRSASTTRGRASSATSLQNASPRGITPTSSSQVRAKPSIDLERKPSLSYGHHRQTSIVHGVQHSRNASLLSPTSSPLSPQRGTKGALDIASHNGILKKSPSMSHLGSTSSNAVDNAVDIHSTQRRIPERMHSGRMKRAHEPQGSQSRLQPATTTVGEFALPLLLPIFIREAERLMDLCIQPAGHPDISLEPICGPGADPAFDQLIWSLGHINRHEPRSIIENLLKWRQGHNDQARDAVHNLSLMRSWPNPIMVDGVSRVYPSAPTPQDITSQTQAMSYTEKRSKVAVYVLCRALIEIMEQTTQQAIDNSASTLDSIRHLESMIYESVSKANPNEIAHSPVIHANWAIRGRLLGAMSSARFDEVSARFVQNLNHFQGFLSVKGAATPDLTRKAALLVQSMRWLKVQYRPETAWEKSCDTLKVLAKFFGGVHGRVMKHAYSELFERLLLPVAATATTELDSAKWKDVLTLLQPRVTQMLAKADHWAYVYPLQAVLLCTSPMEQFLSQWLPLAISFQPKNRERSARSHALKAICRLVWRYLYRCADPPTTIAKKMEEIVKLVFIGGKKVLTSTDPAIADPLIQLIRIIGYKEQDICFRTIIFPLMNAELFSGNPDKDIKIESLDPEKTVIGIRAFLAMMADLERSEPPLFPVRFECDALMDPTSRSPATHRRSRSQGLAVSAGRSERLSRPMITSHFNDVTKEYYVKFCKILGKLTEICDNAFGGQAVLDEKFATHMPKTPMAEAFTFGRREDVINPTDVRQHYYDLLHVAVEALPRCLSPQLSINNLVNLLCTGTAHVQSHIAASSAQSLKSIARQSHAQQVTIGFARFIFKFDDRYATVSDGSLLGPGHIENTLKLYAELLQIWIDDIHHRTRQATSEATDDDGLKVKSLPLDLSVVMGHVDEVESHGLFFLCSPSRAVRAVAVNVLRLITNFDNALGKRSPRIIGILEGSPERVVDINDERLSPAERSRLLKGLQKPNATSALVELCSSEVAHDANLWFKIFPNLIRSSAEICGPTVTMTRDLVCKRLLQTNKTIAIIADGLKAPNGVDALPSTKSPARIHSSAPEIVIEQWRIHLIFACTTLTNIDSMPNASTSTLKSSQSSQHTRKSSKSSATSTEKMSSAAELFLSVVRFLEAPNPAVRAATVAGLSATNASLFQILLDTLKPYVADCNRDLKERIATHSRTTSNTRQPRRRDVQCTELTHLLSLTCHLLHEPDVRTSDDTLEFILNFSKQLRFFLSDAEIQNNMEYHKLRTHFCTLVECLYGLVSKRTDAILLMSFQSRQATFSLMENWCGFSPNEDTIRLQQAHIRQSILDHTDWRSRAIISSSIEKERSELQFAALSAMAMLCAGPLSRLGEGKAEGEVLNQFDVRRMLLWIRKTFDAKSDRVHAIGRQALQNLVLHNPEVTYLMKETIKMCYLAKLPKALSSYFEVVMKVLTDSTIATVPFWRVVCAALYTLGNEKLEIRMKSTKLLRTLEERLGKTSKLQDLDISVSDRTTTVYKNAQFEISRRLALQHTELAFHVFSEFSAYFNELEPDHQRNMVSGMLPWIQTINLQLVEHGALPTATSYMILVNLFEITVKSSPTLHNEIQALWQALATGPYAGNVQVVLDFVIRICEEQKEQNFVNYAKQVVVFLSKTPAGTRVIEYLLMFISPDKMSGSRVPASTKPPVDVSGLPYIADLSEALPGGSNQTSLSKSQVCMILLVDLVIAPVQFPQEKIATLLQVILVQWDNPIDFIQDNARELLVHLTHELVLSCIDSQSTQIEKKSIEDFVENVRRHDARIAWSYSDQQLRPGEEEGRAVSDQMFHVVSEVVKMFSITIPGIREDLGRTTIHWANACNVRHVACRSFQIFRCLSIPASTPMFVDMLARLAGTIADEKGSELWFLSVQILSTLRYLLDDVSSTPEEHLIEIFWTTCACLGTPVEKEFRETLSILDLLLRKINLASEDTLRKLDARKPASWVGEFSGLHHFLYKGIRSSKSRDRSLQIMEVLMTFPSNAITGGDDRLLFTLLANLPRFLRCFDNSSGDTACPATATLLATAADEQDFVNLARVLRGYAQDTFRSDKEFLVQCLAEIQNAYFPTHELRTLVFLLAMVNNESSWFRIKTMQILCVLVPKIDMRKPEIANQGPDLISPLLKLLPTEHCHLAIDVLDNVITMTGTPLDNKHLRMSMAGSHQDRALRKEFDSTPSLYGMAEESGWSVPIPAVHAQMTRANVRLVYEVMASELQGETRLTPLPDEEYYRDDYLVESYLADRTATMMSDETRTDTTAMDLAEKLDTLDDFFDDDPMPLPHAREPSPALMYGSGQPDVRQHHYLRQNHILPTLNTNLEPNASSSSMSHGYAVDARQQSPQQYQHYQPQSGGDSAGAISQREPQYSPFVMNPAAFSAQANPSVPRVVTSHRPGLHNRSITSPALDSMRSHSVKDNHNRITSRGTDYMSSDEAEQSESFSDDDMSTHRRLVLDESFHVYNTSAGLHGNRQNGKGGGLNGSNGGAGFKANIRSGLRRLTSSGGANREAREAFKLAVGAVKSPKVPKVPTAYAGTGGSIGTSGASNSGAMGAGAGVTSAGAEREL